MNDPVIQLESVEKSFGGRPAVADLTLTVPEGAVYGLLGHNGAGKSTTLGMILGQVFPDSGSVRVLGSDVFRDRRAALTGVGAIFETPAFYDYLSGYRNLRIFADYTARTSRDRIDEVVELVGLTDRIGDKVRVYSHGMRQRLALAQALLPNPKLLILDEPADGLDPQGVIEMRRLMLHLNRERGLTLLFSSHQLAEVEQVCSRVAVLHQGRLVFEGTIDEALAGAGGSRALELDVDRRETALAELRAAGLVTGDNGTLTLAEGREVPEVTRFLVERGYRVEGIGRERMTLERFYLEKVAKKE